MNRHSQQKVPLSMERDNVTPSYLRALRVAVLICRAVERNKLLTTKRPVEFIKRSTASASLRIAL